MIVSRSYRGLSMWADDSRPDLDIDEIRRRVGDLRQQVASGSATTEPRFDELGVREPGGSAETPDGFVRVEADGGRLQSIRLDGRVMRMSPAELADLLTTTSNAALEHAASNAAPDTEAVVDFDVLAEQLQDVQNEGLRQMDRMLQGLYGALEVIRQRAVVRGGVDSGGLEQVLQETVGGVDALRRPPPVPTAAGEPVERDPFTAYGMDGLIVVTVRSASRLDQIEIADRAMRCASANIAAETINAANDALQRARDEALSTAKQARSEIVAKAARIQEAGTDQMSAITASLSAMMKSIDRP